MVFLTVATIRSAMRALRIGSFSGEGQRRVGGIDLVLVGESAPPQRRAPFAVAGGQEFQLR